MRARAGSLADALAERHHGRSYLISKLKGEDKVTHAHTQHRRRRLETLPLSGTKTGAGGTGLKNGSTDRVEGGGKALALGYEVMHIRDDGDDGASELSFVGLSCSRSGRAGTSSRRTTLGYLLSVIADCAESVPPVSIYYPPSSGNGLLGAVPAALPPTSISVSLFITH